MYINYLDLPKIPEKLLHRLDEIPSLQPDSGLANDYVINNVSCKPELHDWVRDTFKLALFKCNYMLIRSSVNIHKDRGRALAINYVLNPGGSNVVTSVYTDDLQLLEEKQIESYRWHTLPTLRYHGITGINPSDTRILVSVTPINDRTI